MKIINYYRFAVGGLAILSGILALACLWVGALAVEYNLDAFSDPTLTLQYAHHDELAKWFNLLDLFGYYLLLLPLVFYLHQQYKFRSPWIPLITFCGVAYVLTGALGASILAALWPKQMQDFVTLTGESKALTVALFETTTLLVTRGLWNILEALFASVWWLGLGSLFLKENKSFGIITLVIGVSTLADAVGNILELQTLADIGLNFYLLLGIIWPITVGIWIIRNRGNLADSYTETPQITNITPIGYEHA